MGQNTSSSNINLTRRELLIGGLEATICLHGGKSAFATASQPATSVNFKVQRNACDCHTHIFGDTQRFPFWSGRTNTPEGATVDETPALHAERIVIVNSLMYGTDNSCMLG
jgi:hypothetical protein